MKTSGRAHRDLNNLFELGVISGLQDSELLERFIVRRDEAAFEALVRRHSPLVWGVCRRILRDHHDAEDAFQATFLVFARRAPVITPREMLSNWLYGVARQTASKAQQRSARRRSRERPFAEDHEYEAVSQQIEDSLHAVLDQELSRLPAAYRTPIILCHLEGKGHKEAAEQLGWPVGTLSGRLSRARRMLAKRLARGGFAVSAGRFAMLSLSYRCGESACISASLVNSTVKFAGTSTVGPVTNSLVSAEVAGLAKGVMKAMMLSKIKFGMLFLFVAAAIGLGLITQSADGRIRMRTDGVARHKSVPPRRIKKSLTTRAQGNCSKQRIGH